MEALQLLTYPFLACVCLILIHAYFGIHVLQRGIIFVDLSLAQLIGLGIACSLYLGHEPHDQYLYSALFAVIGAFLLSFSRQISRFVNIEAFIGVLYIFGLSASILVLDRTPHGLEELRRDPCSLHLRGPGLGGRRSPRPGRGDRRLLADLTRRGAYSMAFAASRAAL